MPLEVADVLKPRQVEAVCAEAQQPANSAGEAEHGEAEYVDPGGQRRGVAAVEGRGIARMQIAERLDGRRRRWSEFGSIVDTSSTADLAIRR